MIQAIEKEKNYPWNEHLRTILLAVLLAVIFRSCAYEPFHIPSGSMKSNLLVGDYLFVSKYSYGYSRYSFPFGLPLFTGRILEEKPKRGDVIVFRLPSNPRIDYIKRLIGLPGDTVQVTEGIVYVNGKALPREPLDMYVDDEYPNNVKSIPRLVETLPEGKRIEILKERVNGVADSTMIYTVPKDHYFFMGDNRDNSRDSRFLYEVGYVPEENLVGRADIIFFSVDGSAEWINPFSWFKAMRFNRFLKFIE
jgi:signal peptidase I